MHVHIGLQLLTDRCVAGLMDGSIIVYNIRGQRRAAWSAHRGPIVSLVAAGTRVFSMGINGTIIGWSAAVPDGGPIAWRCGARPHDAKRLSPQCHGRLHGAGRRPNLTPALTRPKGSIVCGAEPLCPQATTRATLGSPRKSAPPWSTNSSAELLGRARLSALRDTASIGI